MKIQTNIFIPRAPALVVLALNLFVSRPADGASWVTTGPLNTARYAHTATLLSNGKVLVAGGSGGIITYDSSAELYDPTTGLWSVTASMANARAYHAAVLLPNGKVLVAGGLGITNLFTTVLLSSSELYDPVAAAWTPTGSMTDARSYHTATLLLSGKVLVAGGLLGTNALSSAELYDPVAGTWTSTSPMNTARYNHTATLLPNGDVLVAGGYRTSVLSSAELYNPTNGTWTPVNPLNTPRYNHTATVLPNGTVLVAGGDNGPGALSSAELYNPISGTWAPTGSMTLTREQHTAVLLPFGEVLVAGGWYGDSTTATAELYDPVSATWTATASMASQRAAHTATLLANGGLLVAGGFILSGFDNVPVSGAEIFPLPPFYDIHAGLPGLYCPTDHCVAWGDYDNDGRLDIVLNGSSTNGNMFQVWRNTPTGFTNINAALSQVRSPVAWGDYDNDGRLDILLGEAGSYMRNTGSAFTNFNVGLSGAGFYNSGAWGDYDNDGRLDILLTGAIVNPDTGNYAAQAQVWHNSGGGFTLFTNLSSPSALYYTSGTWGDYDNDGLLDILLTGLDTNNSPITEIWRNTGSGFTNINAGLPGVIFGSVAWGDYDNDGLLDLLITGATNFDYATGNVSGFIAQVWRNTGNGFSNIDAGLPGVFYSSVAWGDYDNDGRLDILLTGATNSGFDSYPTGPIAQIWRNTGAGFTNINAGLPGVFYSSVAWADYDNDGRLDILLAGVTDTNDDEIAQVWRNELPVVPNTPPTVPSGLAVTPMGTDLLFSWNAATDAQTPAAALSYNLRVGATPGGGELVGPMSDAVSGQRRLPQAGNAQQRLSRTIAGLPLGQPLYWSVQAVDNFHAGSPFAAEKSFAFNTVLTPPNGIIVPGDTNGDGIVDQNELAGVLSYLNGNGMVNQSELDLVLSNYWPYSPWLDMTNVAGLGGTNVTFALTNSLAGAFSVEYSTNLVDWFFLGPATPRYLFTDTNAPADPQRYYRLRWP
jgi:hypothetical protein